MRWLLTALLVLASAAAFAGDRQFRSLDLPQKKVEIQKKVDPPPEYKPSEYDRRVIIIHEDSRDRDRRRHERVR